MRNRQSSLGILQGFIEQCESVRKVLLVRHRVKQNWSQLYTTTSERTGHIAEAYDQYKQDVQEYWLDRAEFLSLDMRQFKSMCKRNEVISAASCIETDNGVYSHLPLMNLHPRSGVTIKDLTKYLRFVSGNMKGFLLKTDRYFHYIGYYVLTYDDWYKFLGKMLVPFVIVNPGYIGYSLLRGYCCIRLTAAEEIKKTIPYMITEV